MQSRFLEGSTEEDTTSHPSRKNEERLECGTIGATKDDLWDRFVLDTPGSYPSQLSGWAELKKSIGWRAFRIVAREGGLIVGGAQLLVRRIPVVGAIGYVASGPLSIRDDPRLYEAVIGELLDVVRGLDVRYLVVHPPRLHSGPLRVLQERNFRPSKVELAPTATLLVDLSRNPTELLRTFRKSTRVAIVRKGREQFVVRECGSADIGTFCRLLSASGRRQGFVPEPESYYRLMYDLFAAAGLLRLTILEHDGEPVSAHLVMPFRDAVIMKRVGWSGDYKHLGPNEVLHWETMCWAKAHGYRFADFDGIDLVAARAIRYGEPISYDISKGADLFKLGFRGDIVFYPAACEWFGNPALRFGHSLASLLLKHTRLPRVISDALRGRRTGQ